MPKKKSSRNGLWQSAGFTRSQALVSALGVGVIGVFLVFISHASNGQGPIKKFVENRKAGMHWAGLVEKANGPCARALEVTNSQNVIQGCSHGPDPAPEGLDASVSVQALSTGDSTAVATTTFPCDGDGISGNRVQMIYAHASDKADRYSQFLSSFGQYASNMNNIYVESGNQTGSARSIRFVTNADCSLNVPNVTLSTTGDDSFGNMKSELKAQGFTNGTRKYVVWADASVYCGISNVSADSQPGAANINNKGTTFSRIDSGCWGGNVETHELTHSLGGVQNTAPNSNTSWHCVDESDRMCYSDGTSTLPMKYICAQSEESRLDCNKDDYFNTSSSIPSTNYLASHWNVANSLFLIVGTGIVLAPPPPAPLPTPPPPAPSPSPTPPPPPPVPSDTILPTISVTSPINESIVGSRVTIKASASDNVGVVKMEIYIDGQLRKTTLVGSITSNWYPRRASLGQHTIVVKAYDAAGNVGQTSLAVYK